jgi:hypothetical protein
MGGYLRFTEMRGYYSVVSLCIVDVKYRAYRIGGNATMPQVGRLLIQPYPSSFPLALVGQFRKT